MITARLKILLKGFLTELRKMDWHLFHTSLPFINIGVKPGHQLSNSVG